MSFQRAAKDLGVTPTAISHQIRNLEQLTEMRLFHRSPGGISHTAQGAQFAEAVLPAVKEIETAFTRLAKTSERRKIVLGAGPVVASRWLAPKLPAFSAKYPDLDLQITNSPTKIWERAHEFDLAIAWGAGDWPGLHAQKLLDVHLVPVLAPDLARKLRLTAPADLLRAPLLHHRDTGEWTEWFRQSGVKTTTLAGTTVEDTNVAVQAALAGTGVMLGVREFLSDDLTSKRLTAPFSSALAPASSYYLVRSTKRSDKQVERLSRWLLSRAP